MQLIMPSFISPDVGLASSSMLQFGAGIRQVVHTHTQVSARTNFLPPVKEEELFLAGNGTFTFAHWPKIQEEAFGNSTLPLPPRLSL